jgi:PAS domain-containing protein
LLAEIFKIADGNLRLSVKISLDKKRLLAFVFNTVLTEDSQPRIAHQSLSFQPHRSSIDTGGNPMKDQSKTKQVLSEDLVSLRERITELEQSESGRKRAESKRQVSFEALDKRDSLMRSITDSAQDAILMMDPTGCISFWNPAAERILGYTSKEAIGKDLHEFLAPKRYREVYQAAFSKF